jgi:hypothetical protein
MPNPVIDVQPKLLDLALYAGDGFTIKLNCVDSDGDPVDMTGTVRAQIRLTPQAADPPLVEFASIMTDAWQGIVVLKLTGAQTKLLSDDPSSVNGKFVGAWDIQWAPAGAEPRTLSRGSVECVSDVTR